jgi:hypothetical protein
VPSTSMTTSTMQVVRTMGLLPRLATTIITTLRPPQHLQRP